MHGRKEQRQQKKENELDGEKKRNAYCDFWIDRLLMAHIKKRKGRRKRFAHYLT